MSWMTTASGGAQRQRADGSGAAEGVDDDLYVRVDDMDVENPSFEVIQNPDEELRQPCLRQPPPVGGDEEYGRKLMLFVQRPYKGQALEPEAAEDVIMYMDAECDGLFAATAKQLQKPVERLHIRDKAAIIFLICYKAALIDPKVLFVKDYWSQHLNKANVSHLLKKLFSRFNLTYHPSKEKARLNKTIEMSFAQLSQDVKTTMGTIVFKVDDYNWLHLPPPPSTIAVGFTDHILEHCHDWMRSALKTSTLSDSLIYQIRDASLKPRARYFEIRQHVAASKRMYNWSVATKAGSLKGFRTVASLENNMKKETDMNQILERIAHFVETTGYDGNVFLVGDFYVWKNAMKSYYAGNILANRIIIMPDALHIAVDAQEALMRHAFEVRELVASIITLFAQLFSM
ncbi:uncharacterized protein EV422DRAFT_599702 [Fimicolochytrium jonesii]|uniref:uncharacterized protein n=1 Tax=Fimicolochytrium jonesii TaxID=1396493 RepID=UPI0022FDF912|nr:uncharacterized protein EV422DRAFT_599702 [Fimicolochytrium jonesii]KAI8825561.1 hypothetical protein EV422DRAFT_599702 [Fimicolochytrium jonesii]